MYVHWDTRQIAIGVVLALMGCGVFFARLGGLSIFSRADLAPGAEEDRFCLGVMYPEARSGLVCTGARYSVMPAAVHRLRLPGSCSAVALPGSLKTGDRITLATRDGRCVLEETARLGGAHRLLTGNGLDVNRASVEELSLLPGIGPSKAQRIVDTIGQRGPMGSAAELESVHGIGPATTKRLETWFYWPGKNQ